METRTTGVCTESTLTDLAVEGDLAGVEGHQDVVDHHGDVVSGQEEHQQNLY